MIKPLLVGTTDIAGGAARAMYRLHQGLRQNGVDSQILVHKKLSDDPFVRCKPGKVAQVEGQIIRSSDKLPLYLYKNRVQTNWSINWRPGGIAAQIEEIQPDIVNLHWIGDGFVPIHAFQKVHYPLVWTLHDMWPFTGGCHYDQGCGRYQDACGLCPQLNSGSTADLSHWVWKYKQRSWEKLDLTIVALSRWMAECARKSSLFCDKRIEIIPNGLDTDCFKPRDKQFARDLFSLPQDKLLILFGAVGSTSDKRKGFQHLQPALQWLAQNGWAEKVELVIFGASRPTHEPNLGLKTNYTGNLSDEMAIALLYAACDVYVAPSTQDNLPNTIMEALACGVPCVAFAIGGMNDMITHQHNGFLAKPFESDNFAQGIAWSLGDEQRRLWLAQQARLKVEQEYTFAIQAQRYSQLYTDLIDCLAVRQ